MLRLCFIVVICIYNWTEATFVGVNNMWLLLLFSIMEISGKREKGLVGREIFPEPRFSARH
jgi:hypothetical protein